MEAKLVAVWLLGLAMTLASACQSTPPRGSRASVGRAGDAFPLVDIGAVLDDFHDAAAKADGHRYFSYWTNESVFLGTDATERWTGDQFLAFAKPYFDQGKGWTYRPRDRAITLGPGGEYAFFDELLDNDKLGVCRGSGVLRRMDGGWRILQYNLSIPVPNESAGEVVRTIRESGKADPNEPRHKE